MRGGGRGWAGRLIFFLDFPLVLFLGTLIAEDLAEIGLSLRTGLASAKEVGLTNGPALLMMDCFLMSSAVYTCSKHLRVSALSLTKLEAALYRLLFVAVAMLRALNLYKP